MDQSYDEQAKLWNGIAGRAWVDNQDLLDQMFKPMQDLLVEAVSSREASRVLDIGCGTGSTTLAIARRLETKGGDCIGADISEPMIAAARQRAERENATARFICADVQSYAFEPASFDMIVSRLGVMFFGDFVAAFRNLRRAAKRDGALCFIAWRSAAENPYMTTAERAAAPFLPNLPARRPEGPGQFAFADRNRMQRILEDSGWAEIDIQPVDLACSLPKAGLVRYFSRLGPVGVALHEADDATRNRVIETVRTAFDPYVQENEVRFTAACWMVGARSAL